MKKNKQKILNSENSDVSLFGKKFYKLFLIWISIFALGMVRKALQNDTFYTFKLI